MRGVGDRLVTVEPPGCPDVVVQHPELPPSSLTEFYRFVKAGHTLRDGELSSLRVCCLAGPDWYSLSGSLSTVLRRDSLMLLELDISQVGWRGNDRPRHQGLA